DRAEIKDLAAYMRAVANPDDGIALQRIINVPARGIGAATVDKIGEIIYERKIPAWKALELVAEDEGLLGSGPRKKVAAFVALMTRLRAEGASLRCANTNARRRSRRCTASWSGSRWCQTSTATTPTRAPSR